MGSFWGYAQSYKISHREIGPSPFLLGFSVVLLDLSEAESIEQFIVDQAFLIWLLAPFRQQVASLSQYSCVSPVELLTVRGGGEEPNHITARKPGRLDLHESFNTLLAEGTICKFKLNSQNIFIVIVVLSFHL